MTIISSVGSDSTMQQLMAQMFTKMGNADTDGISGLSQNELSSIDTGDDVGGSAFLKSLNDQFDSLDSNQNGQLSNDEISQAKPVQPKDVPMGPPPGMFMDSSDSDSISTSLDSSFSSLIDSIAKNVMDAFDLNQDGNVTADEIKEAFSKSKDTASSVLDSITGSADTPSDSSSTSTSTSTSTVASTDASSSSSDSSTSDFGEELKNLSSNFLQKLINSYNNSGGGSFASALTSLV